MEMTWAVDSFGVLYTEYPLFFSLLFTSLSVLVILYIRKLNTYWAAHDELLSMCWNSSHELSSFNSFKTPKSKWRRGSIMCTACIVEIFPRKKTMKKFYSPLLPTHTHTLYYIILHQFPNQVTANKRLTCVCI